MRERSRREVFTMLKRLHPRDKFGGGSGVGLSIVRKIIERHNGKVWMDSLPGEGTTVHIALPLGD
ncbi:MAG: ATP-binding protein [Candidatus Binatia bacterium]